MKKFTRPQLVDFILNEFLWGFLTNDIYDIDSRWHPSNSQWCTRIAWWLFKSSARFLCYVTGKSLPMSADKILISVIEQQDIESATYLLTILPSGMWRFRLHAMLDKKGIK